LSDATGDEIELQKLENSRNIRLSWLSVYLYYQSQKLVHESLDVFGQFKKITRLQYRNGQGAQADVIRAQLEESLLIDKETDMATNYEKAVSVLKYWLNVKELSRQLDMSFPELPVLPKDTEIDRLLGSHPLLKAGENRVKAAKSGVEFANAQFHPGWSLDVSYGYRAGDRSDMVSAMFMFDLPLFTGNKQSKELQASQAKLSESKYDLDEKRRQLRRRYDDGLSVFMRTDDRLNLYSSQLLPQSEQNTEATLHSYQSGVSAFGTVIRAKLTQLQSQLQHLQLKVTKANAQIELLYLAGGR
jgi:outer membrane protein TolC